MRMSSAISPSRIGTLKSARTRTRLPSSPGRSSSVGRVTSAARDRSTARSTQLEPARLVAASRADSWVDKPGSRATMGRGGEAPEEKRSCRLLLVRGTDDQRQVDQAVRIAPLVVVPAEHLEHVADDLGERAV